MVRKCAITTDVDISLAVFQKRQMKQFTVDYWNQNKTLHTLYMEWTTWNVIGDNFDQNCQHLVEGMEKLGW